MDREEIIRMAREAGLAYGSDEKPLGSVTRFAALVAAAALRQALETEPFEYWNAVEGWVKIDEVREHFDAVGCGTIYKSAGEGRSPLYTAPPKQWVGLTDQEIQDLSYLSQKIDEGNAPWFDRWEFARAIETRLQEKNHG